MDDVFASAILFLAAAASGNEQGHRSAIIVMGTVAPPHQGPARKADQQECEALRDICRELSKATEIRAFLHKLHDGCRKADQPSPGALSTLA